MSGMTDTFSGTGGDNRTPGTDRLIIAERVLALVLTAVTLWLHGLNFAKAGGFWRDEANSITLALLPDLEKLWAALQYDSFPILHYLAIRGWTLMFGVDDTSLRLLGLVVGVLLIGALWLKADALGDRVPLVSLLLVGLNPVMVRSLDALRPNGLAALATVFAFTAVWAALRLTNVIRLVAATVILLLCAHLLFQSSLFILAIGIAAIATAFVRGGGRRAGLMSLPFAVTALSLLPYAGHLREAANWAPVAGAMPDAKALLPGLLKVVGVPFPWMTWVWLLLAGVAAGGIVLGMKPSGGVDDEAAERFECALYCGVTMVIAAAVFMLFLAKGVAVSPQPWHYVPLLVLLVVAAEPLIGLCLEAGSRKIGLLLLAAVVAAVTLAPSLRQLQTRVTSMDLVAEAIAREAAHDDLVVLIPWFTGVSFSRYYQGMAPWMMFPSLKERSVHRYDLLKERMVRPDSVADDLAAVVATLQRGGKVWVVGSAFAMEPGTEILPLPPPPLQGSGWSSAPYLSTWNKQLMATLATRSAGGEQLSINAPFTFSQESPLIMVFQGYRQ